MRTQHPRMKLSPEEEAFLRHWMYDEVHFRSGTGQAKRLQLQHGVAPADLATLIAAGLPDPADQEAAGRGPSPAQPLTWPWSDDGFVTRLAEARAALGLRPHLPSEEAKAARVEPDGR